ncbi:MAG: FUSC family protein, partial [Burkholderiales bacterium]
FDRNLFNHFVIVLAYYLIYKIAENYDLTYFLLVFIFTYIFFVLKDSGFGNSLTVWTYIQSLFIATSFISFPFYQKIMGTLLAYLEAQLILYLCFYLIPSPTAYVADKKIEAIKQLTLSAWFNPTRPAVQLAIRGAVTAGLLYFICVTIVTNDIKPNWAVIVAISCLFKDDDVASNRSMISCAIGTFLSWPISIMLIKAFSHNPQAGVVLLWLNLILGLIFLFEYNLSKTYRPQILGVMFMTLALTCVYIALDLNSNYYLHLKMTNNIIGLGWAFLVLKAWQGVKLIKATIS